MVSGVTDDLSDDIDSDCAREDEGGVDALYSWRVPETGCYTFSTAGSSYDTILSIMDTCELEELYCDDDSAEGNRSLIQEELVAGDEYIIAIESWDYDDREEDFILSIEFADGEVVIDGDLGESIGDYLVYGVTVGSGDDYSGGCSGVGGADIAYTWMAPSEGCWRFSTELSGFDTVLRLFEPDTESTCGADPGEIVCDDDSGEDTTSVIEYSLDAGEEIIIVIDGYYSTSEGLYTLAISECAEEEDCLLYTSPSPRDRTRSRMPSSA